MVDGDNTALYEENQEKSGLSKKIENNPTQIQYYSNAQPLWILAFLLFLTFTLYSIYWFYRNWDDFKKHKNWDISPGWKTLELFIPIYSIFLIYEQFKGIRDLALEAGCKSYFSPGSITLGIVFLNIASIVLDKLDYSDEILMFGFLVDLLLISLFLSLQKTLNDYWKKEQKELQTRKWPTYGESALLLIGVILWTLYIT